MIKEFKEFILRGNVFDLAVGIIIGVAFANVVTSFVNDVLMPPIGLLLGGVDFSNLFINLSGGQYETLTAAQEAGAATVNYGLFFNTVIGFLIVAAVIFLLIRQVNRLQSAEEAPEEAPTTQDCPFCLTTIPLGASRCPNCTSQLN